MPKVYMFPNPRFGFPTKAGVPEKSVYLADPLVAEEGGVKAVVGAAAKTIAARSAGRLATVKASSTRSEGPQGSRIKLEEGFLDWYVILDDERSDFAAAKIEKDHGILKGSTPSGERRLAHDVDFAKEKLNKVPKGVEVNLDPL